MAHPGPLPVALTAPAARARPTPAPNAVTTWDLHAQTAIFEVARQDGGRLGTAVTRDVLDDAFGRRGE